MVRRCQVFVEFSTGIIREHFGSPVKCGHGQPASPRRRQSRASLAEKPDAHVRILDDCILLLREILISAA